MEGLESVEKLPEIETEAGMAPDLAKNVMAHYSNGDKELPITFYELSPELYQKSGTLLLWEMQMDIPAR